MNSLLETAPSVEFEPEEAPYEPSPEDAQWIALEAWKAEERELAMMEMTFLDRLEAEHRAHDALWHR